jgi:2-polyprenyl-3-methyl-5-hydroxy-6-metoxy-1,4-benzoquinol methylase
MTEFSGSEMNTEVFDETAVGFASAIDRGVRKGRYVRGELFVSAAVDRIQPGGFILDYGCGPGRISLMLARTGFRVLALDPSPAMIATATQQPIDTLDVEFRVCPEWPGDLPQAPYEAIVCSSVIEYVPDPEKLLRCFSAALRPSGLLIISFANVRSIWGAWCRMRHASTFRRAQRHMWSWPGFRRLLERGGFAPEGRPVYFESPLDRIGDLGAVVDSLGGTLGLVVARTPRTHLKLV